MILKSDALRAALAGAADASDRGYLLNTIQVRPDGTLVATDGHVAFHVKDRSPWPDAEFPAQGVAPFKGNPDKPVCVPTETIGRLLQAMPKPKGKRGLTIPILGTVQLSTNGAEGGVVLSATDLQAPCQMHVEADTAAGSFPNTDRVMPGKDRPALKVVLSVEVLKSIVKAAEAVRAAGRTDLNTFVTLYVQTGEQHQARELDETIQGHKYEPGTVKGQRYTDSGICEVCGLPKSEHERASGTVVDCLRAEIQGETVDVDMAVMPCRI